MSRVCLIATLLFLVVPAAAPQEAGKPSSDRARVIVYRNKQESGRTLHPSIYCDDIEVARLQGERYAVLALAPGPHMFRSDDKQSLIELDVEAGKEYYIRIDTEIGTLKNRGRLTLVDADQGASELKPMKPISAEMVKHKAWLASDFHPAK